jgi:hypothetical protein
LIAYLLKGGRSIQSDELGEISKSLPDRIAIFFLLSFLALDLLRLPSRLIFATHQGKQNGGTNQKEKEEEGISIFFQTHGPAF